MMNLCRLAGLTALGLLSAICSPIALAQLAPAAAVSPSKTLTASPTSSLSDIATVSTYSPPTEKKKLQLFEFDAFGPYAFATAALGGGVQQATKSPPEWGTGWDGFGMRVASNYGIQLVTTTTRYGMAEILREDAAYYRCECKGFLPRVGHALISTITARHGQDGHTEFSFSGLGSPYAGTMAALAWYPGRYGVKDGFRMGNYNLAAQAGGNLALEFIYGGPHTLFGRRRGSQSPNDIAEETNP
jgi:hypothetical protein